MGAFEAPGRMARSGRLAALALVWPLVALNVQAAEVLFSSTATGSMQLHAMAADGKSSRALTAAPGDNDNAVWSNNGARIAFVSTRDGQPQVYVMDADGSNQKRISPASEISQSPAWSPDSRSLAYAAFRDGKHGVYMQDLASGKERLVTVSESGATGLAWSPSADKLAFATSISTRKGNVLIVDLTTGNSLALPSIESGSNSRPVWAPDSSRLAFVNSAGRKGINIYTCNPDGSDLKAVTQTIYSSASPTWSPDGKAIAFTSNLEAGERGEIFVAHLANGGLTNLTRHEHEDLEPAWAADSREIYFVSFRNGTSQIYKLAMDGTTTRVSLASHYESTPLPRPNAATSVASASSAALRAEKPNKTE